MANGSALRVINTAASRSTPVIDTKPATAQGNELEIAIRTFQSEVNGFANSMIKDPKVRADYIRKSVEASQEILEKVKARQITPHEAAMTVNEMRNQIMICARSQLTDFGLAISAGMKKSGKLMESLEAEYAIKKFGRPFNALSQVEREAVWMEIVNAAGRPRQSMNRGAKMFGFAGRAFLVLSLAISVYNVIEAEDKARQAAKEGVSIGAGIAGGIGGGAAVAFMVSNPAGWVVGLSMFAGAALLGVGSSEVFDYFWPEK